MHVPLLCSIVLCRYVSNSSGKHDFYFSHNKRFIFKTEPKRTMKTFLEMLE